jgi:putative selenium metabolism hydrolase
MAKPATFENALAFAQDLIRLPSPPGEEEAVARRVAEEMEALGMQAVRIDEVGNVIGVVPGSGRAPAVMLNSHVDVVAEGDAGDWEHPPYGGVVADGFLHGRGAMDIKGPLALQTYAAAMLQGRTEGDVIVAHTVLEERGGWGMHHLLESGTVTPSAVIIGEATQGDIAIGHRGRGELEVVLHGVAGHASAPARAANALDLVPAALAAIEDLAADQPADDVLGPASLVVTGVEVLPESRNVIPDRVTLVIDWRVLPDSTDDALVGAVESAIAARVPEPRRGRWVEVRMARERQGTYTGLHQDRKLFTPGFLMDPDHPVVNAAAEAVGRRDGGARATVRPWTFATDGGWSCGIYGIPTVGFAPGEERFAHTNRERLDVEEARWGLSRYPDLILAVQRAAG